MKTNTSPVLPGGVQEYVHLQREIHDALRKEHPEWVEPNGESLMCDFYERVSRNSSKRSREGHPTPGKKIFHVNDRDYGTDPR